MCEPTPGGIGTDRRLGIRGGVGSACPYDPAPIARRGRSDGRGLLAGGRGERHGDGAVVNTSQLTIERASLATRIRAGGGRAEGYVETARRHGGSATSAKAA